MFCILWAEETSLLYRSNVIGIDGHPAWFEIDEDREIGIDIDNVDKQIKEK